MEIDMSRSRAIRRRLAWAAAAIAVAVLTLPLAFFATIVLMPLWSFVESHYGIESVGHSGPADWCFAVTYGVVLLVTGVAVLAFARGKPRGI
jgi:hypothetical protein